MTMKQSDLPPTLPSYLPSTTTTSASHNNERDSRSSDTAQCNPMTLTQTLLGVGSNIPLIPMNKRHGVQEDSTSGNSASRISAAQFTAGTGGLAFNPNLLAKVRGTDPALMGSEDIRQIMRCPDLLSIYQKLQEEDDRRQRRLERNRASAKMRREKKRTMVEVYEAKVNKLEHSLNLIRGHSFGVGKENDLVNALDYCGGEHLRHVMMSKEAKQERLTRMLSQHCRFSDSIRKASWEIQVLTDHKSKLFESLKTEVGLSEEQIGFLRSMSTNIADEGFHLEIINKCFSALRAHEWLFFSGMETLFSNTKTALTVQQLQKLLRFTTENQKTISDLKISSSLSSEANSSQESQILFKLSNE
uniref:Uncharacterized protein AlNc14C144G7349 n=1 Tax=Albugo laibachii Nc14 TaxID=890382 RepID=F0WLG2_9STRA|nr:conserved hypothetical protein [Albugo laibachii Nc14]CCA23384.1 conserved hypothetical protein [Albugo laibachii Nc14]|eukprot:CCA23384.1 conserved hypothetical protein [Albugo laibachii Nc14]